MRVAAVAPRTHSADDDPGNQAGDLGSVPPAFVLLMASERSALAELRAFVRFARGLGSYLREPLTPTAARERIFRNLAARERNFLDVIRRGVFAVPDSPYRRLLEHAGISLADIEHAVATRGLEATLDMLFEAGVYLRLDEFKGRRPIERGSLRLHVTSRDFDNPLATRHLESRTGGSRSGGMRIYIDLEHYAQNAAYEYHFLLSLGLFDRPAALWYPTPPQTVGLGHLFQYAKLGLSIERWFSQSQAGYLSRAWKHAWVTAYALRAGRLHGHAFPSPEHVPLSEAWRIAEWLAEKRRAGKPAVLHTNSASGVRVCLAAKARGLDIAGTLFRLGSEPVTPGRARVVRATGCTVAPHYAMGESGRIGMACTNPDAVDDVHLLTDKIVLIRRERSLGGGVRVKANIYTTLLPSSAKLMLNVESDDYGVVEQRSCGCLWDRLGFATHFHTIRSYEKLTSEGMNYLGADLIRLVEDVLPARFGGAPTDYQFVEDEDANGLPQVNLVVSPRVGPVPEAAALDAVIGFLNQVPGASDNYGEHWRQGGTLRLIRREPHATSASKILALHVTRSQPEASEARAG